jgi:hypothetical protein
MSDFWKTIPKWSTGTYQSWKDALLRVYPGNQVAKLWSISDLDKLKGETLHVGIRSLDDFTWYFTTFYTISNYLITQNHYSETEQSRDFPRVMQQELWSPILDLLHRDNRAQHRNLPFSLRQMFDTGNEILHAGMGGGLYGSTTLYNQTYQSFLQPNYNTYPQYSSASYPVAPQPVPNPVMGQPLSYVSSQQGPYQSNALLTYSFPQATSYQQPVSQPLPQAATVQPGQPAFITQLQ